MPSDSPHMSVCVDQPLAADSNEPVGWRGGGGGVGKSPHPVLFSLSPVHLPSFRVSLLSLYLSD